MIKINVMEAYKAMICFLENYYYRTLSDDIGSLLGDMQLSDSGDTWDPVVWKDWIIVLDNKISITTIEAFKGMFKFLQAYYIRTSCFSNDIKMILDAMQIEEDGRLIDTDIWRTWIHCVEKNT